MKCFIRSASWVTAGFGQRFAGKGGINFQCQAPIALGVQTRKGELTAVRYCEAEGGPSERPSEIPGLSEED